MKPRNAVAFLIIVSACLACRDAHGLSLNLNLGPADFTRTRIYSAIGTGSSYTEALDFKITAAGTLSPGDPVDVQVSLDQPIRMENHFNGAYFGVLVQLAKGSPPPFFIQALSTSLTLPGAMNFSAPILEHSAWTDPVQSLRQQAVLFVTPTAEFGRITALHWQYTAPSWTPANSAVRFDLSFQIVKGDRPGFPDPGHNLITFVPEPSAAALAAILLPLARSIRAIRRPSRPGILRFPPLDGEG